MNQWGIIFLAVSWIFIIWLAAFSIKRSLFSDNKKKKNK
jgi:hypothetical protein